MIANIVEIGKEKTITVLPITHSASKPGEGVEIPAQTKSRLGLDDQRSWIVTTEANEFVWPGPDLRIVSRDHPSYGQLPEKLVTTAMNQSKEHLLEQDGKTVDRREEPPTGKDNYRRASARQEQKKGQSTNPRGIPGSDDKDHERDI